MLERFTTAQDKVFDAVLAELAAGRKTSHWMWFVFPQLKALGRSPTAQFYGLADLAEARAYLGHTVLGPRLIRCCELVLATEGKSAHEIFGTPDNLKLKSSMTLFGRAGDAAVFGAVLDRFYDGVEDPLTLELLER